MYITVYPGWSWYATVSVIIGAIATFIGSGMVWLGFRTPRGTLSLPDTEGPA
jgi:hypothetical protein